MRAIFNVFLSLLFPPPRVFGRELSFVLPRSDLERFPDLFTAIERDIAAGVGGRGISSYGVSMTTLEEIFLKLGEEEGEKEEGEGGNGQKSQRGRVTAEEPGQAGAEDDMAGFSFEAVETNKSSWQMFKALSYVSADHMVSLLRALVSTVRIAMKVIKAVFL